MNYSTEKIKTPKTTANLKWSEVKISELMLPAWNPRKIQDSRFKELCVSIQNDPEFLQARPVIASDRTGKLVVVAGNMRARAAQSIGMKTVPTIVVTLTEDKEKQWGLKDNLHAGEWDWDMLADFDESFLKDAGFDSETIDRVFEVDESPEVFDLARELKKLDIQSIETQRGDIYEIGPDFRLMNGNSMEEADILKLMNGEKANLCLTDPPYLLDYVHGKKKSKSTEGFGYKRDRRYLETDELPDTFTELWMGNIAKVQKPDFSIITFENPKNLRIIWNELEKHWRWRNTITWHIPNRVQGFAAKYKFFSKTDIALVGTTGDVTLNLEPEEGLFQEEYENALFATSGKPEFESPGKGKKYCPTDFVECNAANEKSSGQNIIFGTKPEKLLLPYLKVLTHRGDLVIEPFGGSGSTGVAALKLGRRCYMMEKSLVYTEIIKRRIEKLTGLKAKKIYD
jgi:DNA modification methylase